MDQVIHILKLQIIIEIICAHALILNAKHIQFDV